MVFFYKDGQYNWTNFYLSMNSNLSGKFFSTLNFTSEILSHLQKNKNLNNPVQEMNVTESILSPL